MNIRIKGVIEQDKPEPILYAIGTKQNGPVVLIILKVIADLQRQVAVMKEQGVE